MMKEDGIENIVKNHKRHADALRAAVRAIGLKLFVEDDSIASCAITSILSPDGISVPDIRSVMKKDFDIIVANGQNELKDKIFRMGTLGFVCDRDIISAVGSLEASLYKLGYKFELGAGVKAAIEKLHVIPQR
jgi:aspartate aminotransferase-like enzyme